jgi:CheY-like chemotaxis protein
MAGEPILIVDDTPVNLKLTRILLVNEGYQVQTAASAEEALDLLREFRPRLILADIQLPGMDGLEMTRRIRRNEKLRDITIVALTAFAMKGDEQKAMDAGCDGYITKPIDTRSLGERIRQFLLLSGGVRTPGGGAETEHESVPVAEILALRRRFLNEGQERARQLLLDLDGEFDAGEAARAVHQWVGTSGLLGYAPLGRLAREIENLLRERPLDIAQLRESLTNLLTGFSVPPEAHDAVVPQAILQALAGKTVAMVGLPLPETERLCVALERGRAKASFFELATAPSASSLEDCSLVITYVRPETMDSPWLDAESPAMKLPTVFVGARDDLQALAPEVQGAASGLLMDGWQPDEALVRLSVALTRVSHPTSPVGDSSLDSSRRQILIAGDDDAALGLVRMALESFEMECHITSDGDAALEMARQLRPRAGILDLNLPGAEGYELLAAIRAEGIPMRIILLTARQREHDILRGFALGADDYIVKPFSPLELMARLMRLLGP